MATGAPTGALTGAATGAATGAGQGGAATGTATGSPTGSPTGSVAGVLPATGTASSASRPPLDLGLPRTQPVYPYRPPLATPRRSLAEMANEQLRRKPRDPFAESMDSAGHIDCAKGTPPGPAQGLMAIGPLIQRAIEDKCKK